MSEFLFVLKDKGTSNQGWWLKISNADELCDYYEATKPTRYGNVFENYVYGKEWNWAHPIVPNESHAPHINEVGLTECVVRWGSKRNYNIIQSIQGFSAMVVEQQLDEIHKSGAIYINAVSGYHGYYPTDKEYAFVRRKELIFPDFKKDEIRVKQFPGGEHYYAYIGDMQVRDGDTLKWDSYQDAYEMALSLLEENEKEEPELE